MSKFEKLLDLLVNEQKDEAEKLFHDPYTVFNP